VAETAYSITIVVIIDKYSYYHIVNGSDTELDQSTQNLIYDGFICSSLSRRQIRLMCRPCFSVHLWH